MRLEEAACFVGPNIFSARPVTHYRIAGSRKKRNGQRPRRELDSVDAAILREILPALSGLNSTCEASDFFGAKTPDAPSDASSDASSGESAAPPRLAIGHAIEHLALELQNSAGAELECVRTRTGKRIGSTSVVLAFDETSVCAGAAELACDLVDRLLSRAPDGSAIGGAGARSDARAERDRSLVAEFLPRIEKFLVEARRQVLPVQDRAFVRAARDRDVPTTRLAGRILQLGQGRLQKRVSATKTSLTDVVSNDIAANKDYSRKVLALLDLPVPRYARVHQSRDAVEAARAIGFPVVVKPNQGNMGKAVSVGVRNRNEVRAAYKLARDVDRSVLVEELIEGEDYRVLVINGKFCAASKRVPAHVEGDGIASVEQLVARQNQDPRRGRGPRSPWTKLKIDERAERLLGEVGYTRESVPSEGETVFLRRNANTSDGGTATDVTDSVHPENREIAVRAARAIGLDIAGVDFLTKDIGRSILRTGGRICEINSRPGLRKHMWPAEGEPRDIMTPIVDMLYPPRQPSRIPIVAVLGLDKPTARAGARILAHLLESKARRVGLAVERRVHIGQGKSRSGRLSAPEAARKILFDPDVDVAVFEMTTNDVVRSGLGCDAFTVSLIVSSSENQIDAAPVDIESSSASDPASAQLPRKIRDAVGVVAGATRELLITNGSGALLEEVRKAAGEVEVVSLASANRDQAPRDLDFGEIPDEQRMVAEMAFAAALRLGVREKKARRALATYNQPKKARPGRRKRIRVEPVDQTSSPPELLDLTAGSESSVAAAGGRSIDPSTRS